MSQDYKTLFEKTNLIVKEQEKVIANQDIIISELKKDVLELQTELSSLTDSYNEMSAICREQQEILNSILNR